MIAVLLRVYALDRLPPGLFGDEAVEGLDALDVLAGNLNIWFHAHLGREPLFVYLVAIAYRLLGVTPLATRVPALIAGLITVPAAFFCVREWALSEMPTSRANRLAFLSTILLALSFWHIQMTRDAHRDVLLPLVESVGFGLFWRALRTSRMQTYVLSGAVLGLAIYTYSPGRFVGILVALFVGLEFVLRYLGHRTQSGPGRINWSWRGLSLTALMAALVMLPLGAYFSQNPVQFSRRFESVSVFDADSPPSAFASSVVGNLMQFVVPGAGYQSLHYNLPGTPIFDLWTVPWFVGGVAIAFACLRRSAFRFLVLWFAVMLTPAFLTADMIPKAVRAFGVLPGVLIFPALTMDAVVEHTKGIARRAMVVLITGCLTATLVKTTFDYFVAWGGLPELPLAFDADMVEASAFANSQPPGQVVYLSSQVYRHPTWMLLGKRVPTTQYFDRSTKMREFDARTCLLTSPFDADPLYFFVRDDAPGDEWLRRLAPESASFEKGEYVNVFRLGAMEPPQHAIEIRFNPLLELSGYTTFRSDPNGLALFWQVVQLPGDRTEATSTLAFRDSQGKTIGRTTHTFGVPPMEWLNGDRIVEWFSVSIPAGASQFIVEFDRGSSHWESPPLALD